MVGPTPSVKLLAGQVTGRKKDAKGRARLAASRSISITEQEFPGAVTDRALVPSRLERTVLGRQRKAIANCVSVARSVRGGNVVEVGGGYRGEASEARVSRAPAKYLAKYPPHTTHKLTHEQSNRIKRNRTKRSPGRRGSESKPHDGHDQGLAGRLNRLQLYLRRRAHEPRGGAGSWAAWAGAGALGAALGINRSAARFLRRVRERRKKEKGKRKAGEKRREKEKGGRSREHKGRSGTVPSAVGCVFALVLCCLVTSLVFSSRMSFPSSFRSPVDRISGESGGGAEADANTGANVDVGGASVADADARGLGEGSDNHNENGHGYGYGYGYRGDHDAADVDGESSVVRVVSWNTASINRNPL